MSRITIYSDRIVLGLGLREVIRARYPVDTADIAVLAASLPALRMTDGIPEAAILDAAAGIPRIVPQFRAVHPAVPVIAWEHSQAIEPALNAIGFGAQGVLLDTSSPQEIFSCLDTVLAGGTWLPAGIAQAAVMTRQCRLSRREGQLMSLVATGLSNKEIAWNLGISVGTVKVYLCRLFEKLGVSDRYEMALLALRQNGGEQRPPAAGSSAARRVEDPPRSVFIPRGTNDWRQMIPG